MATRNPASTPKAAASAPKPVIDPSAMLAEFTTITEAGEGVNPSVKSLVEALDRIPVLVATLDEKERKPLESIVKACADTSKSLGFDTSRGNVLAKQIAGLKAAGLFEGVATDEDVQAVLTRWAKIATPTVLKGRRGGNASATDSFPKHVTTTDPRSPGWSSTAQTSNNLRQAMLVHERDAHGNDLSDIGDAWLAAKEALLKGEAAEIPGRYVFSVS